MAVLSIGQVWATDASVTLSSGTYADSKITWTINSGNTPIITIKQLAGNGGAVNSSYISAPRVYKGNILSFEAASGYKINSISITCNGTYLGKNMTAGIAISNNTVTNNTTAVARTWSTASGGSHTVSAVSSEGLSTIYIQNVAGTGSDNVQLRPTAISVTYTATGGDTKPTISADPDEVAYGTKNIYGKASLTGYVDVAVSGSNLKGNITATLNGTDKAKFSLSGAPFVPTAGSASGTLRVSYNVTEEGDYSASVRLASTDADNVDLPITLKVINQEPVEYVKVTSSKTDWSGEYLIVYEPDATTARVWNGVDEANGYVEATISSGKVTMPEGAAPITIASMTGGYSLLVNGGDNDGKYMQNNGSSNGIKFVDEA